MLGFLLKDILQKRINQRNRSHLLNQTPTLICSNCTGGFLYHWLGLQFRSPFINLYLTPSDFISALSHLREFVNYDFQQLEHNPYPYPVGVGLNGELIHFVHYKTFKQAKEIWQIRTKRMDYHNLGIMLTNWGG